MQILKFVKLVSFLFIGLNLGLIAKSQNCSDIIQEAEILYEKGLFNNCIELLSKCDTSQDVTLQWQKHRLLAMSYLLVNNQDKAEDAARSMLKLNPEYVPNALNDPVALVRLIKSIMIIPQLSVGASFSAGSNFSLPNIRKVYSLREQEKTYRGKAGLQFGLNINYQFNQKMALDFGLLGLIKRYALDYSFDDWNLKMNEQLNYFNVPVVFKFMPSSKTNISPFVGVGLYGSVLLTSTYDFSSEYIPNGNENKLQRIPSVDSRERLDYGPILVAGLLLKKRKGAFFIQTSYSQSMVNVGKGNNRYDFGNELLTSYYYLEDDFRLQNIALTVGYLFYFNYKVLPKNN